MGKTEERLIIFLIEDKRKICQDNHATLIEIYEEDIGDLESIFKKYYKNP